MCGLRSSTLANGCGESRGERFRGDLVRCVPKVAPVLLREGVLGRFGALKGPEWVGVRALVEAAMMREDEESWVSVQDTGRIPSLLWLLLLEG